jgi:hypothetical protein
LINVRNQADEIPADPNIMHVNMYEEGHRVKSARKLPATLLDALRMDYI